MKTNHETEKELCVLCGAETPYNINDHIDMRQHYIEGAGQLCAKCYDVTYNKIKKVKYGENYIER